MLTDRDVDISQFITFNAGGIVIADYNQIQSALVRKYKEVYGYDIDLANTTADGIFINNLALIINNILRSFNTLYSNLNVQTASGEYLDMLCRLSNITRKQRTQSSAYLNISSTVDTILYTGTTFVDTTGNEWVYNGQQLTITANSDPVSIQVTCSTYGAIVATAHSITQTLELTDLIVDQPNNAAVGQEIETDNELRSRRDESNGSQGVTVLESLVGALLAINGVKDVKIYTNNTNSSTDMSDGMTLLPHSIYPVVRLNDNISVDDSVIGQTIYNSLTPGISTNTDTSVTSGTLKSVTITPAEDIVEISTTVTWKEITTIHPQITITITPIRNVTQTTYDYISEDVLEYLNNLKINSKVSSSDIIGTIIYSDTSASYQISNVTIASHSNALTAYHYTNAVWSNNTLTLS